VVRTDAQLNSQRRAQVGPAGSSDAHLFRRELPFSMLRGDIRLLESPRILILYRYVHSLRTVTKRRWRWKRYHSVFRRPNPIKSNAKIAPNRTQLAFKTPCPSAPSYDRDAILLESLDTAPGPATLAFVVDSQPFVISDASRAYRRPSYIHGFSSEPDARRLPPEPRTAARRHG